MNLKEQLNLSDENYNLLFDIRRSVRYHDRRKSFFYAIQNVVSFLSVIMAGVVIMDAVKQGITPYWMISVGVIAAILSALDLVIGFSKKADMHSKLREKFADLEIDIITGPPSGEIWLEYQKKRLVIEKDEPAIYFAIDGLCRNELLIADGFSRLNDACHFAKVNWLQRLSAHWFHWQNATFFSIMFAS
ncbi:hypothetical protein [Methylocucumis oryzae]|uniref:SMODS and SLOG-associating 2TM effector domain-containing protein n=1 Tax=Methylocucumis oryzae TaxID=1632867 RepID=A0A0F3IN10_9GAMM|nr:hypothetical protein [Methylocucumis oryzae]KJV08057.1 hypothetical protein VZ94_00400 [Methylocucumis oryzae]